MASQDLKAEDALAGDWGRTNEEPYLGLPGNDDWLGLGCGGSQLHKDDRRCNNCNRYRRVHHDAQLAMVSVRGARMEVSHLGDGQHRQKDQAQTCDNQRQIAPAAVFPAGNRR